MKQNLFCVIVLVISFNQVYLGKKIKKQSRQLFALDEIENLTLDRSLRQKQSDSLLTNSIEPLSNKQLEKQIFSYRPKFKKLNKKDNKKTEGRILSIKEKKQSKKRKERKLSKKKDEIVIEYQEVKPKKKTVEGNEFFKKGRKLYEIDGQYLNAEDDLSYYNYI